MHKPPAARGITLVETAVAVAVLATLIGTAAPGLRDTLDIRRLDGAATGLATDLQLVRTEAVARQQPVRISFHQVPGASCWVVHTGLAAQCDCSADGPAACSGGAREIKTVRLPVGERVSLHANMGSIVFDPLHGTGTPTGTLRLVGTRGRAVHHVVNVMGRVRSCSPAGAMPGYRAC